MSDFQEYGDVVQEVRGALNPGRLKLQRNSVIFKNNKTGKVDQFQSSDIEKCQWLKRARGYCLKVILKSGNIHRYDGFKDADHERLNKFLEDFYDSSLEKVDMSIKGWNWGLSRFEGNSLNFEVDKNQVFEIPLSNVSHTTTSKNEVTLEFHQNDDAAVNLMELRFHIPSDPSNPDTDTVGEFYKKVMDSADIIQATGESVVTLSDVQCLTPRGRYDIKMYPSFLQLHGKTFDYKIPNTTILRLFLLPHKDGRQMFFVVSLDPPIKQGQTRYHFLILLFQKEDEMTVEMGMDEEDLKEKYEGKLEKEMTGLEFEIVSKLFKTITGRKITVPGSFVGHSGTQAISCSYKAATGLLYPLERGFIFVHKPPLHIRFDEIAVVNFARSAGNTRSFDFDVELKSKNVFNFVGIEKDEYGKLYDFVTGKKLRVKNIGGSFEKSNVNYTEDMSDSDNDKGDHDAYMEKMKREGKQRAEDDDDDDDSSDESFNPGDSGSEVAEEYDSNPPTTDSKSDSDSDYSAGDAGSGSEDSAAEERREKRKEKEKDREKKKKKSSKTVSEGGKRKKKNKQNKDPNAPKRPQSAYFLWLNDNRAQLQKDNPGLAITEISKIAGEMWKELTDKSAYEEKAREVKTEYELAMAEYLNKRKQEKEEARANAPDDDEEEEKEEDSKKAKKKKKKSSSSSPKKSSPKKPTKSEGGGEHFKSKEFISDSESSDSDSDDKPLKKKAKKDAKAKKQAAAAEKEVKKEASEAEDEEEEGEKSRSSPVASSGGEEEAEMKEEEKSASEKSEKSAEESDAGSDDE